MSGDEGDHWRERREYKRKQRAKWWECPTCKVNYGGNGTKNPPGQRCHNCNHPPPEKRV